MAQTVVVEHDPGLAPPGALVAALNGAMLEASLTIPRAQAQVPRRAYKAWGVVFLPWLMLHRLRLAQQPGVWWAAARRLAWGERGQTGAQRSRRLSRRLAAPRLVT